MSEKREIEVRGANVEQAIATGLSRLGLSRRDVLIEVLDEGSRGLLGLGSRDAVVRLKPLALSAADLPISEEIVQEVEREASGWQADVAEEEEEEEVTAVSPPPAPYRETAVSVPQPTGSSDSDESVEDDEEKEKALEITRTLLQKMDIQATVSASRSGADDLTGRRVHVLNITGDDLGALIGSRGNTLGDLQYVLRLMVGHQLQRRANFVVDVDGYRQQREQALTALAERMARKAAQRGKPVALEPMPSHERRVIHMTLRNHDDVYTQSVGEGSKRKVRIYPKNDD